MTNNLNSIELTDKEQDLENLRFQSDIANFESKYDLDYPLNASMQTKTSLGTFFAMLKYYFTMEVIPENEINWYYQEFLKVPDENKGKCITALQDLFEEKLNQNIDIDAILVTDEANREAEKIAAKLSPKLREEFYYYINTGEELTPEIRDAIDEELSIVSEAEVYSRLERVLDNKETLNIGLRQPQRGKALTPDQVAAKFNLEKSIASDESEVAKAEEKDPLIQLSSQTQSLYELVKLNRDRIAKQQKDKKIESQNEIDEAIVTGTRSNPAGLDQLLKK